VGALDGETGKPNLVSIFVSPAPPRRQFRGPDIGLFTAPLSIAPFKKELAPPIKRTDRAMIVYDTKRWYGYGVFLHLGKTVLRAQLPFGLIGAILTLVMQSSGVSPTLPVRGSDGLAVNQIGHPNAVIAPFSMVLSFLLVFRTNMAYQRWWEARTNFQIFSSKLGDTALHLMSFTHNQKLRDESVRLLLLANTLAVDMLRGCRDERLDFRPVEAKQLEIKVNDEVEAKTVVGSGSKDFQPGIVTKDNGAGRNGHHTYDVRFDNGTRDPLVPARDIKPGGGLVSLTDNERHMLSFASPSDRLYICIAWLHVLVANHSDQGEYHCSPPVLSRAIQVGC
jgi:hypothetical protein